MTKTRLLKILGLIGAFTTGIVMIANGGIVDGIGVISASLASSNLA